MLKWKAGLEDSKLFFGGQLAPYVEAWYGNVKNSTGFKPYRKKATFFPEHLQPLLDDCMPIYRQLLRYSKTNKILDKV